MYIPEETEELYDEYDFVNGECQCYNDDEDEEDLEDEENEYFDEEYETNEEVRSYYKREEDEKYKIPDFDDFD